MFPAFTRIEPPDGIQRAVLPAAARRWLELMRRACFSRLRRLIARWATPLRSANEFTRWRIVAPASCTAYRLTVSHLSRYRFAALGREASWPAGRAKQIVYYIQSFPTLNETFIQREIAALGRAGMPVQVIAHKGKDAKLLGPDALTLQARTIYLQPIRRAELVRRALALFRQRPVIFVSLLLYVLGSRYDIRKSPALDCEVFAYAIHLASVLRTFGASNVHAPWASIDAFIALCAARLLNIPYTVQARAYDIHRHTSAAGLALKLAGAAFVITNSKYNESRLRPLLAPGTQSKIRVIYNGLPLDRFHAARNRTPDSHTIRILLVASFVEPKGMEYLLMACKILRDRGYPVRCEIVGGKNAGEMNYYIAVRKLHKRLGLEKEVLFSGRQPFACVFEKYRQADVFVFPAVTAQHGGRDITPNVILEAMAMELPVVSTNSGAIPEIIEDGVSGILVPPRDEQALADAIIRLRTDPALAGALAANARRRIEERFDIDKNIVRFVALFRDGAQKPGDERRGT